MNVPSSTFVQWLIGEPPCGWEQMSAQAWHHSGKSGVFYTTYVGKKWARLKISQFCQNFEGSIHLYFHSAACLQGTAAHTQVLLWCGANSGKLASCAHVVHTEPVHLGLSLFCCGAVCLQEKVHQSVSWKECLTADVNYPIDKHELKVKDCRKVQRISNKHLTSQLRFF